jgi:hypothetical protein
MKTEPDDIHELVEALRADLPTERDAARIRARLAGFGVALGAGITSSEAVASLAGAKAAASAGSAGLWSQFAALSWGAKVGIAAAVSISAVTGPLIVSNMDSRGAPVPAVSPSPKSVAVTTSAPKLAARESEQAPASIPKIAEAPADTGSIGVPAAPVVELRTEQPAPPPRTPSHARQPVEPVVAARSRAESAHAVTPPAAVDPVVTEAAATPVAAAHPAEPATTPSIAEPPSAALASATTLGEETRLIDAAFSALRAGDRATAENFVREHERRFPNGMLRRERERAETALMGRH